MKKIFRKLFASSGSDGVGDKSRRKLRSSPNKISKPFFSSPTTPGNFDSFQTEGSPTAVSTPEVIPAIESSRQLHDCRNDDPCEVLNKVVCRPELHEQIISRESDVKIIEADLTPLLKAVETNNIELVKSLIAENKFQTDINGNTALHIAVERELLPIAQILVRLDPLVNVPNKAGELPLHLAVSRESFPMVELLLKNKAVVNVEDGQKRTALLIALTLENVSLVHLLLKYGAKPSVCTYLSSSCNPKMKILHRNLRREDKVTSFINDDDSQNSEYSCILPPVLSSPKSWNVLHPKLKENENCAKLNVVSSQFDKSKKSIESVSPIVDVEVRDRPNFERSSKPENCDDVFEKLSPEGSHPKINDHSRISFDNSSISAKVSPCADNCFSSVGGEGHSSCRGNYLDAMTCNATNSSFSVADEKFDDSSSCSDEEPLMWENSHDGGYFTEWSRSSKLSDAIDADKRSKLSSDDEFDDSPQNKAYSVMLSSLQRATQENKDLETETAVLRESVEKLKYDLANYREEADIERISSTSLKHHLSYFDEKYSKAIENVGTSQLYISNLEKEISHLKRTYKESCKINRFLAKELKKSLTDIAQIKSTMCETCGSSCDRINKLLSEIEIWKIKYENVEKKYDEKNLGTFFEQDLLDIHSKICRVYDKIRQYFFQTDIFKTYSSEESRQIANEIEQKINDDLSKVIAIFNDQVLKVNTPSANIQKEDIMKRKLFLEVSKLTSLLKDKELKEEQLESQVQKLRDELQKSKRDKRNLLIRKTFRNKYNLDANKKISKDFKK